MFKYDDPSDTEQFKKVWNPYLTFFFSLFPYRQLMTKPTENYVIPIPYKATIRKKLLNMLSETCLPVELKKIITYYKFGSRLCNILITGYAVSTALVILINVNVL